MTGSLLVTTSSDAPGASGETLRAAIAVLDTSGGGTITFAPGITTIDLQSVLVITTSDTIEGGGTPTTPGVIIDAQQTGRVIQVDTGANLILSGIEVTGGNVIGGVGAPGTVGASGTNGYSGANGQLYNLDGTGSPDGENGVFGEGGFTGGTGVSGGTATGGGIFNNGSVTLINSVVTGNVVQGGMGGMGGMGGRGGNGGNGGNGITESGNGKTFVGRAGIGAVGGNGGRGGTGGTGGNAYGGGVYNNGVVVLENSSIIGNSATAGPGGVLGLGGLFGAGGYSGTDGNGNPGTPSQNSNGFLGTNGLPGTAGNAGAPNFAGYGPELQIDPPTGIRAYDVTALKNISITDPSIDVTLRLSVSAGTLSYKGSGGTTVTAASFKVDGTQAQLATLLGSLTYLGTTAGPVTLSMLVNDGSTAGTVDVAFTVAACYAAGTQIATPDGEAAIETLRPGDHVRTAAGAAIPVVWTGHRRVACRRHPRPADVQPIRVRAGAFAEGQPSRDLLLSPDHAVFAAGLLVPVRHLVNGLSIVQQDVETVTYWHVELPAHDLLLAESLPAESYLDTGNRSAFVESGGALALHPDFAPLTRQAQSCADLTVTGPRLQELRRHLNARARRASPQRGILAQQRNG